MYSRNYYPDEAEIKIPENYDGIAFSEKETIAEEKSIAEDKKSMRIEAKKPEPKFSPSVENEEFKEVFKGEEEKPRGLFGMDFLSFFGKLIPGKSDFNLKSFIPKIEAEELLILGLAAFLFFSKEGDKECALILLVLIFIQ